MTSLPGSIGVLGASSPLVPYLLPMLDAHADVVRFSRSAAGADDLGKRLTYSACPESLEVRSAVSLMPIWELAPYLDWLADRACRRLVVLSSTSRFTKTGSGRAHDRELARRLTEGEDAVIAWALDAEVALTILRPTMVYGGPADGNVSELVRLLRRFRAAPIVGSGAGLRQPVHMADVAAATASALRLESTPQAAYNISGAEVLTYRQLVHRVRGTVPGPTMVVRVPGLPFRLLEQAFPRSRRLGLAAGMVDRMGTDMVFDHASARADLDHRPRVFEPGT